MKLYTFLDDEDNIIEEVRAETHAIAYKIACDKVDLCTEFFSETIGNKEENENKKEVKKMKKLRRHYTKDNGKILWLTNNDDFRIMNLADVIEVDVTKSNLIAAIKSTEFPDDIRIYHHTVSELMKIAKNYNLLNKKEN